MSPVSSLMSLVSSQQLADLTDCAAIQCTQHNRTHGMPEISTRKVSAGELYWKLSPNHKLSMKGKNIMYESAATRCESIGIDDHSRRNITPQTRFSHKTKPVVWERSSLID
jgi:hypothetical protein